MHDDQHKRAAKRRFHSLYLVVKTLLRNIFNDTLMMKEDLLILSLFILYMLRIIY